MNTTNLHKLIKKISVIMGLALGAFAISAAAQVWNPAPANPPSGNVDAPINSGLNSQSKLGQLLINTDTVNPYLTGLTVFGKSVFEGSIQIKGGAPAVDKVLVSDASGNATWAKQGFDFSGKGTYYSTTVNTTKRTINVGPSSAKAAALSFAKPGGAYCSDFVFNVYDAGNTSLLLGRVWAGVAAGDIRNGVGGFMIVPTNNGNITLERESGDDLSCFVDIIKIADIY